MILLNQKLDGSMGVRKLFSRGAKFSRGTYYLPLKTPKNILFCPAKGGGARAPSCPPLRTPMAGS